MPEGPHHIQGEVGVGVEWEEEGELELRPSYLLEEEDAVAEGETTHLQEVPLSQLQQYQFLFLPPPRPPPLCPVSKELTNSTC